MNEPKRILVIDDHPLIRLGISTLLLTDYEVFEAGDRVEARQVLAEQPIDVATVDLGLEADSGLEIIREIRSSSPMTKCLVVTQYTEWLYEVRARLAGARGFLSKQSIENRLVEAVETVINGGFYPDSFAQPVKNAELENLSQRELEIFLLLGQGFSTAEIADSMDRSRKTVEAFRDRMRIKLNLETTPQLVRMATHWCLSAQKPSPGDQGSA